MPLTKHLLALECSSLPPAALRSAHAGTKGGGRLRVACFTAALFAGFLPQATFGQDPAPRLTPAVPGSAVPTWQRSLRLSDGRVFVTDGGMAIDVGIARPATLPPEVAGGGSAVERLLSARTSDEFRLPQLTLVRDGRSYRTPSGVALNQTYVAFLRRSAAQVRLRTSGPREPVVIVLDGRPAGVFMPVAQ